MDFDVPSYDQTPTGAEYEPGLTILLVEDNPGDIRLAEEFLRDHDRIGVSLYHERTLQAALSTLDRIAPDLVLLDLGLPDASRLVPVDALREEYRDLPLVVLTGRAERDLGVEAVRHGAQDFLTKRDLTADRLWRTIRHARERASGEGRLRRRGRVLGAAFHALEARIAVLDARGHVLAANRAWRVSVQDRGAVHGRAAVGENYLEAVRSDGRSDGRGPDEILKGVEAVLAGETERFESTCHFRDPDRGPGVRVAVARLDLAEGGAVVTQTEVSPSGRHDVDSA